MRSSMLAARPTGTPSRMKSSTLPGLSSASERAQGRGHRAPLVLAADKQRESRRRTVDLIDEDGLGAGEARDLGNVGEGPLALFGLVDGRERVARLLLAQHADEGDGLVRLRARVAASQLGPGRREEGERERGTHEACWSALCLLVLALDEPAVNDDRVLAVAAHEGRKDVVPELAVARLGAQLDRVLVVERARDEDLAPGELGDGGRAAGAGARVSLL